MRIASSILIFIIFSMLINPASLIEDQNNLNSDENNDLQSSPVNVKTISFEIIDNEPQTSNSKSSNQNKLQQKKLIESKSSELSLESAGLETNIPIITPLELIPPEFGTPPADNITYEMGSEGNTIKWKVNEDNPDRYNVYANGTFLNTNTWSTGFVFTNVDTLTLGIWNITVVFNDTFGNELVGERYATVVDTTAPNILGPSDSSYLEGTSGHILQWNVTDLNPNNYEVRRDGLLFGSGSWINPSNTSVNIDGLNKGVYSFSLTAYDVSGNMITDSAIVTVNDDPAYPSFNLTPNNTTISEISSGNILTWNASDDSPDTYFIYLDEVEIETNFWISNVNITTNLDSLDLGIYNYTIVLNDTTTGFIIKNTVFVTVSDQTLPSIDTSPSNQIVEEDTTDNWLSWGVSDLHNDSYDILKDLVIVQSGFWDSGGLITINIDNLAIGIYTYELRIYDESGNLNSTMVTVDVRDLTNPTLVDSSGNLTYNENEKNNNLFWNTSDKYEGTYQIFRNSSLVDSGAWTNATQIVLNVTGLLPNDYNYTLVAIDFYGNMITSTLFVFVIDITIPIFVSGPGNQSYVEGIPTLFISWSATDAYPTTYNIYKEGVLVGLGFWISGSPVSYNIGGLSQGLYNFTIIFYDRSNNNVTNTIFVEVSDTADPLFTSVPGNYFYSEGTSGNELEWIATDNHPDYYEIYKEGIIAKTGSWVSSATISLNIDGLSIGSYNYTIIIYDISGNFNRNQLNVTVSSKPVFTSVPVITEYLNNTVNVLSWIPSDADPNTYEIYQNESLVDSGNWLFNGEILKYNITSLGLGLYNFTIFVTDTSAGVARHTIWLTITDLPILQNSPGDTINYSEGTITKFINWTATDSLADSYLVYINDLLDTNTTWVSGNEISINVGGLLKGVYNYTIVFEDESGNQITDTVILTVTDDTSPFIIPPPPSPIKSFEQGDTNQLLIWNVTDNYADKYVILLNGSSYKFGNWVNATFVIINIDDLLYGVHNVTIYFFDESNNSISDEIIVTVFDITPPSVVDTSNSIYSEGSLSNIISWNATDFNALNYSVMLDGSDYQTGLWASGEILEIDIDGLSIGNYTFEITFFDVELNFNSDIVNVTVIDSTKPILLFPGDQFYGEGTVGNSINWTATDTNPNNFEAHVNGSSGPILLDSGLWSLSFIEINVDGLSFGAHIITLIVFDSAGNNQSQSVQLIVGDITAPAINATSSIQYEEGTAGNFLVWIANDNNPGTFIIKVNGSFLQSGDWNSSFSIILNIDEFSVAVYAFTITVFDSSDNQSEDTILVSVVDTTNPIFIALPINSDYAEDETNNKLFWNITDNNPNIYTIYRNNTELITASWILKNEIIELVIDGRPKGVYNYTIVITDDLGNQNSSTIIVTVFDDDFPTFIVEASPISYFEETTGYELIWIPADKYNATYIFFIDNIEVASGSWSSGLQLAINIDGLLKGIHSMRLEIYDESLNLLVSTFDITVIDNILPVMNTSPVNLEFDEGSFDNLLDWNVTDVYPSSYTITVDNQEKATGSWGDPITFSLDYLLAGIYNITIIVYDESSNFVTHSLVVTVIDKTDPVFVTEFVNITYQLDSIGNFLLIDVFDNNPDNFILRKNGIVEDSGSWANGVIIQSNIDGLDFGEYNFTVQVFDKSKNVLTASIIVKVTSLLITETIEPDFDITDIVYESDLEIITGFWLDINGTGVENGTVKILLFDNNRSVEGTQQQFETDSSGKFTIQLNYTDIPSGNYSWEVTFNKDKFETQILTYNLQIKFHAYLIELSPSNSDVVPGKEYFISVTVYYADNRSASNILINSLGLNEFIPIEGFPVGLEVEFKIQLTYQDGTQIFITKIDKTDLHGVAFIWLKESETTNIQSIDGVRASISESLSGEGLIVNLKEDLLPNIATKPPSILQRINNFVAEYSIIIIALVSLIAFGSIVYVIINQKRNKRFKLILDGLSNGKTEFEGILSLQAIILMSKGGIPLFEERYEEFNVNPTLVAGMSSAISAFFNEFGDSDKIGFETMERSGMSITSHKSTLSTIVIISSFRQPDVILEQIQKAQILIENRFHSLFSKSIHTSLLSSENVHEEFEKADFKISLKGKIRIHKRNLRKVIKLKSISRNLKDNLVSLEKFVDSLENGDKSITLREIMNYFGDQNINNEFIAKLVLLAYKHSVIQSIK